MDGYRMDRMYMSEEETDVLRKIRDIPEVQSTGYLLPGEYAILERIIHAYTRPKNN